MKTLRSGWNGLRQFGINFLTGESDGYSMRVLCDVNEDGKKLLEDFFGNTVEIRAGTNWNSTVEGKPAIGSILLTPDIIFSLKVFALFHVLKFDYVIYDNYGDVMGVPEDQFNKNFWSVWEEIGYRYKVNWGRDRAGVCKNGRNIHQMSGRVV